MATLITMMQNGGNNAATSTYKEEDHKRLESDTKKELEQLKQENQALKAAITQRTTQANDTIVRLSQRN